MRWLLVLTSKLSQQTSLLYVVSSETYSRVLYMKIFKFLAQAHFSTYEGLASFISEKSIIMVLPYFPTVAVIKKLQKLFSGCSKQQKSRRRALTAISRHSNDDDGSFTNVFFPFYSPTILACYFYPEQKLAGGPYLFSQNTLQNQNSAKLDKIGKASFS